MTVLVLLGAPGAGKGTQAALLAEELGIPNIATGDLFRAAVRDGSAIGLEARRFMERGQLVPDDITIRMLLGRFDQPDAKVGAILDGFPRNGAQAKAPLADTLGYLHLDVDVLDPSVGHANYLPVPKGLSLPQLTAAIAVVRARVPLGAAALTSYSPEDDHDQGVCRAAFAAIDAIVTNGA